MKLIIDRGNTKKGFYTIQFGVDFDTIIFSEKIWMSGTQKETMAEIDRIVTLSTELKNCVLYIKHPLLLEHDNERLSPSDRFFVEKESRHILREYFAIRLIHRRYDVELFEFGKRLFK